MKYLLSVVAVLSAPLLYGLICVPTIGVIMSANADLLNDSGGTDDVGLLLQIEAIQAIVLLATGQSRRPQRSRYPGLYRGSDQTLGAERCH